MSPYTFMFFFTYLFLIAGLTCIPSFFFFWFFMELTSLLFMGLCLSVSPSRFSSLMIYFLTQAAASLYLLVSYLLLSKALFSAAVLLKMGVFPFMSWYLFSLPNFSPLPLFLGLTLQKVPLMLMIFNFELCLPSSFLILWLSLNLAASGCMMLVTWDFRLFLVISSVSTGSWLLLSQESGLPVFMFFFVSYFSLLLSLFMLPSSALLSMKPLVALAALSGLPPSPLFFAKLAIITQMSGSPSMIPLFLVCSVPVVCSYFVFSFSKLIMHCQI